MRAPHSMRQPNEALPIEIQQRSRIMQILWFVFKASAFFLSLSLCPQILSSILSSWNFQFVPFCCFQPLIHQTYFIWRNTLFNTLSVMTCDCNRELHIYKNNLIRCVHIVWHRVYGKHLYRCHRMYCIGLSLSLSQKRSHTHSQS